MTNTKLTKLLMSLILGGLVVYLGGSVVRTAIAFEIYIPGSEMILKASYNDALRLHTARLFAVGALYTDIAFILALITTIGLNFSMKGKIKHQGWIFMSFILIYVAAPIELYISYLDLKLNLALWAGVSHFDSPEIKQFFVARFTKLTVPSAIAFMSVATALMLSVWKPLDRSAKAEATTEVTE